MKTLLLLFLSFCACSGAELNIDVAADLVRRDLKQGAKRAQVHPLALKIIMGNIADSDPYVVSGVRLRALEQCNAAVDFRVVSKGDWVELWNKELDQRVFSYRELGRLADGSVLYQCLNSEGGSLDSVRFIVCDLIDRAFYIHANNPMVDSVLIFSESFGGLQEADIEHAIKRIAGRRARADQALGGKP